MPLRVVSVRPSSGTRTAERGPGGTNRAKLPFDLPHPAATRAQRPAGISLCMIVRNEERFLEAALSSVAGVVDEINIVDTGSTDRTLEIAARFGARIEHRAWRNDFAWARNEAIAMATRRWVFVLDADEQLDPGSRDALASLRSVPTDLTGVWVRCENLSNDYKGTGVSSHALARIFPNDARLRYRGLIHEFITLDDADTGIAAKLSPIVISHFGYLKEVVTERRKAARNFEIIRAATERAPLDPFNWYNLGNTALIDGRYEEGIVALERMRELVGDQPRGYVAVGLSMLAEAYTDFRNDPATAIAIAEESLRKSPRFSNAHFALGRAHTRAGRYAEARAAFLEAIEDGAHNKQQFVVDDEVAVWKAHSEIGNSYGKEGNNLKALEWFEKALVNRPSVQPLQINRARALEAVGRVDDAEAAFAGIVAEFHDDASALDYVNFLLRHHRYERALEIIEETTGTLSTEMAVKMLVTAAAVAEKTSPDATRSYLDRALALHPGSALALSTYETYLHGRGEFDALRVLRAAELLAPCTAPEDFARRSSRLLGEQRPADALRMAVAGLEQAPQDPALAYDAAAAVVQLGEPEKALDYLAGIGPDAGPIYGRATFLRSIIAYDLGRDHEALGAIEAVLGSAPDELDALLHRVRILERLGRVDMAEAALRSAMRPGDQRLAIELASLLMRCGRPDEARLVVDSVLVTA